MAFFSLPAGRRANGVGIDGFGAGGNVCVSCVRMKLYDFTMVLLFWLLLAAADPPVLVSLGSGGWCSTSSRTFRFFSGWKGDDRRTARLSLSRLHGAFMAHASTYRLLSYLATWTTYRTLSSRSCRHHRTYTTINWPTESTSG